MNPIRHLSNVPRSLLIACFMMFVLLAVRIVTTAAPIMASDEYAYFATAKFSTEAGSVFAFDPGMQAVGNRIYPLLYRGWDYLGDGHAASVGRLFNALLFVLGAFVLFPMFSRIFDRRAALQSALLYLLMPFAFYATTLLPEVEFQISVYLAVLVVVLAGPRPSYQSIVVAAALSALSYFIKPHAAALIGATAVYMLATGWLQREKSRSERLMLSISRSALYVASSAILILLITKLVPAGPAAGGEVVASFYRSYIDRIFDVHYILSNLAGFADYFAGHLWLLLALFAPGLWFVLTAGGRLLVSCFGPARSAPSEEGSASAYFAMYVLLLLLAFLAMIAVFTNVAGAVSDFEKYRLHGRYLAPILPLLLGCSVWAVNQFRGRVAPALGLIALVTFVLLGRGLYKLFPWDYPEAFGLFGPSLRYWGFQGAASWAVWVILLAGIVGYGLKVARPRISSGYMAFLAIAMISSNLQMWRWVDYHVEANKSAVAAADAIESYLGDAPAGSGLVLTLDRYGRAPYLLMGLDHPQFVRTTSQGATISAAEIPPGTRWIVAPIDAQLVIPGASEGTFGDQRLYLIKPTEAPGPGG